MNRKTISDIIVSKKSIRQIPISIEKRHIREIKIDNSKKNMKGLSYSRTKETPNWHRKPVNPKFAIWLVAIICLLALFFGISIVFSSATITITPKTQKITFTNDQYFAKSTTASTTDLSFEVLNVKQTDGEPVEATAEKDVNKKATGKIIIYNNYSTSPQRLINNTRFEANNGKVYRIDSSVVVPGLTKVDGKITPGSIEATVFADQAGDSYNLKVADLTGDFKIPGFKGDVRYQGFYARLKEDITGGFIGKQRIVADDLRKTADDTIKLRLKEQLLRELYTVKPENYLILKDGYSINYTDLADSVIDTNKVKINIQGELNGIVFNNSKLASYLVNKKIGNFDGLPVEIIPSENLVTTFKGEDSANLWNSKTIEIGFTGDATIKWLYDSSAIKKDLAGKKESDLRNIAYKYKDNILGIKVTFRPVWTRYFPDNSNKIKIEEETI